MSKYNYYGRRILKVRKADKEIFVLSGQWIGHRYYGDEYGSDQQRKLLLKACGGNEILAVSENIVWNQTGYSGDVLTPDNPLVLKAKFSKENELYERAE